MADDVPIPQGTGGISGFQAHDWYSYQGYQDIHFGRIEHLRQQGIILADGLTFRETRDGRTLVKVHLRGFLTCAEDVLIKVGKLLAVRRNYRDRIEVKGADYDYHARLLSKDRNLIRYCSAHGLDDLHYHRYDLKTGEEIGEPRIRLHELPLLGDFIIQAVELGRQAKEL